MSKHFRLWKIDQTQLLPPSVQDFVPKDHLSRFIVTLVRESLDLREIAGSYTSALGQPVKSLPSATPVSRPMPTPSEG